MKTTNTPASGGRQSPVAPAFQGADAPRSPRSRSGFTLIELLVVMGLIILLAAITITVSYSGLIDNYRTVGAGDRVSKWLVIAKVKAQRDQTPCGVRFYADANGLIREAQYIEAPDSYVPVTNDNTNKTAPVAVYDSAKPNTIEIQNVVASTVTPNNVAVNDTISLPEYRLLLKVTGIAAKDANTVTVTVDGNVITNNKLFPANSKYSTTAFGFLRAARPMVGEEMLLLTGQTAIDGTNCSPVIGAGTTFDVLFAPNGEVLGTTQGSVILWIRDPNLASSAEAKSAAGYDKAGQQGLVTVYTKTGSVATHPVTRGGDPYAATRDGINTGL
jgi:prepilin-type N-terminal cleavage/methylation domain-containing protein